MEVTEEVLCSSEDLSINEKPVADEEATGAASIPSNVYEYFQSVEEGNKIIRKFFFIIVFLLGKFPFFNNTQVHVSAMRNENGETLLIAAARLGHLEIVERLVCDIDIEETDNDGWTALLNAAHQGHAKVAKILLCAGASVDNSDLVLF